MGTIQLNLEIEEVNKILNALGSAPYKEVFLLIQNIQEQATPQLQQLEEANGQLKQKAELVKEA